MDSFRSVGHKTQPKPKERGIVILKSKRQLGITKFQSFQLQQLFPTAAAVANPICQSNVEINGFRQSLKWEEQPLDLPWAPLHCRTTRSKTIRDQTTHQTVQLVVCNEVGLLQLHLKTMTERGKQLRIRNEFDSTCGIHVKTVHVLIDVVASTRVQGWGTKLQRGWGLGMRQCPST